MIIKITGNKEAQINFIGDNNCSSGIMNYLIIE